MCVAGRLEKAHRVAWAVAAGPLAEGEQVLHHCDRPPCIAREHLFKGTQADNLADMRAKGRAGKSGAPGALNGRAKLTNADVAQIREAIARGDRQVDIAARFSVTQTTISRIARGDGWKVAA
jgi:hypothetical protein